MSETMPTLTQQERTPLQKEKELTMQQIFNNVEALVGEGLGLERLALVKQMYEEVKGKDYMREQALKKLIEYYELELSSAEELRKRVSEIISIYPGAVGRIGTVAANDENVANSNEQKYNIIGR